MHTLRSGAVFVEVIRERASMDPTHHNNNALPQPALPTLVFAQVSSHFPLPIDLFVHLSSSRTLPIFCANVAYQMSHSR